MDVWTHFINAVADVQKHWRGSLDKKPSFPHDMLCLQASFSTKPPPFNLFIFRQNLQSFSQKLSSVHRISWIPLLNMCFHKNHQTPTRPQYTQPPRILLHLIFEGDPLPWFAYHLSWLFWPVLLDKEGQNTVTVDWFNAVSGLARWGAVWD